MPSFGPVHSTHDYDGSNGFINCHAPSWLHLPFCLFNFCLKVKHFINVIINYFFGFELRIIFYDLFI